MKLYIINGLTSATIIPFIDTHTRYAKVWLTITFIYNFLYINIYIYAYTFIDIFPNIDIYLYFSTYHKTAVPRHLHNDGAKHLKEEEDDQLEGVRERVLFTAFNTLYGSHFFPF